MPKRYFRLRPKSRAHRNPPKPHRILRDLRSNDKLRQRKLDLIRKDSNRNVRPYYAANRAGRLKGPARVQGLFVDGPPLEALDNYSESAPELGFARLRETISQSRKTVCESRYQRQQVLFAKQIAGHKGRSPGAGGTYKRTEESKVSCERSI